MGIGGIFTANLNAANIHEDLTYLSSPILHKFWLTIKNQSINTLYFKIVSTVTNWSLSSPATGQLGSIASGVTSTLTVILTRTNPGTAATDTGTFTINAYSDSGYTTLVSSADLSVTINIEDLEAWTNVTISDFDDGTAQGWTLSNLSVSNDLSVETGGYSLKGSVTAPAATTKTCTASKSVTLPDNTKVRIGFYLAWAATRTGSTSPSMDIKNVSVQIDSIKVLDIPFSLFSVVDPSNSATWLKIVADLSSYANQTVTVAITFTVDATNGANPASSTGWIDRIVIAGSSV